MDCRGVSSLAMKSVGVRLVPHKFIPHLEAPVFLNLMTMGRKPDVSIKYKKCFTQVVLTTVTLSSRPLP